jgi:hypothetical protein
MNNIILLYIRALASEIGSNKLFGIDTKYLLGYKLTF